VAALFTWHEDANQGHSGYVVWVKGNSMADSPESENFFAAVRFCYAIQARQILREISSKSGTSTPYLLSETVLIAQAFGSSWRPQKIA
jgi:hypothetical protein